MKVFFCSILSCLAGYIYDPLTGIPYDPITREPIDLGTGTEKEKDSEERLEIECLNKFLNFIDYYNEKPERPNSYEYYLRLYNCYISGCYECQKLPEVKWSEEDCTILFCDLDVPEIIEEPIPRPEPEFPPIVLPPGDDDEWVDEPEDGTLIEANPLEQHGPVWWYHSDHLGSTSYITDVFGKPVQYIEYLPFGEVMVEQSTNNILENVYKFNAKELDTQTGYYYYGARYYDPGASIFLSVDPAAAEYPNINPYTYVANNPINAIDPDGKRIVFIAGGTRYTFNGKNLFNGKGVMMNPKSYEGKHLGRIVNAYINVAKSDKDYKMQIQTLIDSKNDHLIDADIKSVSGGSVVGGNEFDSKKITKQKVMNNLPVGSTTTFNFDESLKEGFQKKHGVTKTDESTVAHEMRHQYDFEIGNMADSYGKENNNNKPSEMRAVRNEDSIRETSNIGKRVDYDGKKD